MLSLGHLPFNQNSKILETRKNRTQIFLETKLKIKKRENFPVKTRQQDI